MAKIKHKLFLIPVINGNINLNEKIFEEINIFLDNENIIYLNHSISTISKEEYVTNINSAAYNLDAAKTNPTIDQTFKYKNINTFCVLSLVYKDLKDSNNDVSKLSEKSKKIVRDTVQSTSRLPKPTLK